MSNDATTPEEAPRDTTAAGAAKPDVEAGGDVTADAAAEQENSLGYSTGLSSQPDESEEDVAEGVSNPGKD